MRLSDLSRLDDRALLRALSNLVAQDRLTAAALLAHLGEVDARRLHLPAGYPSMHAYCVGALRFSTAAAYKRIQAARVTREHPALLEAVADGRLHLTAVCMLAPHLTSMNVQELIEAAACRTQTDLVTWLGERFAPPPGLLPLEVGAQSGSGHVQAPNSQPGGATQLAAAELALRRVEALPVPWPSAPAKSLLHLAITARTRAKLARAQAMLGHEAASGDLAQVVDRALDALIAHLERRRARAARVANARPAPPARAPRTIPVRVKREVWRRDKGQCSYVGIDGQRCPARKRLEFDHIDPVGRGGGAEAHRIRLLCRAHNQFEADRVYGAKFMRAKRGRTGVDRRGPDRGDRKAGSRKELLPPGPLLR